MADKIHETVITPEVGMAFQSEDVAYDMYNDTYAGKVEFNIKKEHDKIQVR
jgi:hypothetical protein